MSRHDRSPPRWRRYLRFIRADAEADVDEEIDFHLAMRAERNVAMGMSLASARADALSRFGDVGRVRHDLVEHDQRRESSNQRMELMSDFLHDVRFGLRSLRRAPGFAAAAILTLALGIGANAAIYSVVDAVVLRPLPFATPQELFSIGRGSMGELDGLKVRLRSFSQIAAYAAQAHPIHDGEQALRVEGAAITTNTFSLLGVAPMLGRDFVVDDGRFGNNTSLIISHSLWQRQFGADRAVIGRRVDVEGAPFTIVGVMPEGFAFPSRDAQYWQPYAVNPAHMGAYWATGDKTFIGRLAPGVNEAQAQGEVAEVWPTLRKHNPLWDPGENYRRSARIQPLQSEIVGSAGSVLWMLFGCVALVLLIGCINVANLLLARATARQRELSVRAALGGGRGRLVRQLVTESMLLSVLGAALGILLAHAGVRWLVAVMPTGVPRAHEITVDGSVLIFTAAVALITGVLFGVVPAVRATSQRLPVIGGGVGRRSTSDASQHRVSGLLVMGELALAVLVVTVSVLLVRSFIALRGVEPGFRTEQVVAARISPPAVQYREAQRAEALYTTLVERIAATPGVQSAAVVDKLPLAEPVWGIALRVQGQYEDNMNVLPTMAHFQMVGAEYFSTLGIPVLQGRGFTDADRTGQAPVAIVSESVVRRFWPNGDALGQRIGYPFDSPWLTVVGIVPDVKQDSLRDTAMTSIYVPWMQRSNFSDSEMWLVARSIGDPGDLARRIRAEAAAFDRMVAVSDVRTMEAVLSGSVARTRFTTVLVAAFAMAALLLGAIGIYGVMSYVVGQRAQEMGVRLALGATPGQVLALVMRRGAMLAIVGAIVGIAAAIVATRSLSSMLYGVTAWDPLTFVAVPLLFLGVAAAASWIPGRRATRVDPVTTLRSD